MLARALTYSLSGLQARPVTVEVDVRPGLPAFAIVGLSDRDVRESRERIRTALLDSGYEMPLRRVTANVAPASLRKTSAAHDLPLACATLAASGQIPADGLQRWALFGGLDVTGSVRPARGALCAAEAARSAGLAGIVVARSQAAEAAQVDGLQVAGVDTLLQAVSVLGGGRLPRLPDTVGGRPDPDAPDFSEVRGCAEAIAALQVAAAGGHHVLLRGGVGTGKTMLARRLPSILPEPSADEQLAIARIQSVAGVGRPIAPVDRPFRAPHHTISSSGLVGGGAHPMPGEVTLAHHGVLFLDELTEFARGTLDALRHPLEDGAVHIVRGERTISWPADFQLVAAAATCPCGFAHYPERCTCSQQDRDRYQRRLAVPAYDHFDVAVTLRPLHHRRAGRPAAGVLCGAARRRRGRPRTPAAPPAGRDQRPACALAAVRPPRRAQLRRPARARPHRLALPARRERRRRRRAHDRRPRRPGPRLRRRRRPGPGARPRRPRRRPGLMTGPDQLALGNELGCDDHVDVYVYDRWGRLVDLAPAHLGDRQEPRDRLPFSAVVLFGLLAIEQAETLPPTWATLPCHDHRDPRRGR